MSALLYSVHDQSGHQLVPAGGWCVESIALAENPQPQNWTQIRADINWILRLNWAHNGRDGTIPLRGQYDEFAKRCTDYMAHSKGCNVVVIANEPNHRQEYPNGVPISPEDYADCFNLCFRAITHERPDVEVCTAAVAPWDITSGIDWLAYYKRMLAGVIECDGLAVHGYTHGADPNLIWSTEKTHGWYWHFPVIYQTIQAIPPEFATRPVHVTETDQGDNAWADANSGWVQNAYQSVDEHNKTSGTQKICSLALYRWRGDKYAIHDKNGVQDDFRAAVAHGYLSPVREPEPPTPTPPDPEPPRPTPAPEPEPLFWDHRLTVRGCSLQHTLIPTDTAPLVTVGRWFSQDEAQGRVSVYVRLLDEQRRLMTGVPVAWFWPGGSETKLTERKSDPWLAAQGLGAEYSLDFAMYDTAPSYGVRIGGEYRGDVIDGCGLGSIEQPDYKIHTAYFFEWQLSASGSITPPISPPTTDVETGRVTAPLGLNVRRGPGTGFDILGTLIYGSTVLYLDARPEGSRGWLKLADGYVSAEYVGEPQGADATLEPPPLTGALVHPLPGSVITQRFGEHPENYVQYGQIAHNGTDLAGVPAGSPIRAIADGVVYRTDYDPGYGNYVMLAHAERRQYSVYCHCSELLVLIGSTVSAGQEIALVGNTGNSTADHLHLEMREMNADGSYGEGQYGYTKGRVDPETVFHALGSTL